MGWMFDSKTNAHLLNTKNVKDLKDQPYYNWLKDNYLKITLAQPFVYFAIGGLPAVVWGFALRTVFSWHITWAVNSISHMWGR
jgi:fatty-acid desaturase